jgi:AcrR family transcriptional regulator
MTIVAPKEDRRIQRTRQLLRDSLMELIVERGFSDLTIQDITDRANVSRTTFYLHYRDKYELLFDNIQILYTGLISNSIGSISREGLLSGECDHILGDPGDYVHVAQYADFYRAMLSKKGDAGFIVRVEEYLAQLSQSLFIEPLISPENPPLIPAAMAAHALAGAQIGMVIWWLKNDMPLSPEEMAQKAYIINGFGLWGALGLDVPKPKF